MSTVETHPDRVAAPTRCEEIMGLERAYLLQNYGRYPLVLARGKGCYLYDVDGKRYLDLISGIGVNALGHAHPRIMKVIREQASKLIHSSNLYYHEYQGALAKRLVEMSGMQRAFFCNSGTEATEGALKMIRAHGRHIAPEKIEVISLENSFHGRSFGSLSITGQPKYRKDFEPLLSGVHFVPRNDIVALEQVVCERTAGIVIETIQGEGGIYPVNPEYFRAARQLATRYNALLVADEIQCGVGRPGVYFAYQLMDPVPMPDIVVLAKPISCGLPLGVILANDKAAAAIAPGMHGTTFGGGALTCRVALEFLSMLDELMPRMTQVGNYFKMRLEELGHHHSFVKEVRGFGLMLGVELHEPGSRIVLDAMKEGVLLNCTHETVLRFLPPYILTEKDVDKGIAGLKKAFAKFKAEPKAAV